MQHKNLNRLLMDKIKNDNDRIHKKKLQEIKNKKSKLRNQMHKDKTYSSEIMEQQKQKQNNGAVTKQKNTILQGRKTSFRIQQINKDKNKQIDKNKNGHNYSSDFKININNNVQSSKQQSQRYKKSVSNKKKSYVQQFIKHIKQSYHKKQKHAQQLAIRKQSQQENIKVDQQQFQRAKENFENSMKIFQNIYRQKKLCLQNKTKQDKFNKPQQIFQRIVLYKKSIIISSKESYLIQISAAHKRLFILLFSMQNPKIIHRLIYKQKQYNQILAQNNYNFGLLAAKVHIQENGIYLKRAKLTDRQQSIQEKNSRLNENKELNSYQKQVQFIKRNFYNKKIVKNIGQNNEEIQKVIKKVKSSIQNNKDRSMGSIRSRFRFDTRKKGNENNKEVQETRNVKLENNYLRKQNEESNKEIEKKQIANVMNKEEINQKQEECNYQIQNYENYEQQQLNNKQNNKNTHLKEFNKQQQYSQYAQNQFHQNQQPQQNIPLTKTHHKQQSQSQNQQYQPQFDQHKSQHKSQHSPQQQPQHSPQNNNQQSYYQSSQNHQEKLQNLQNKQIKITHQKQKKTLNHKSSEIDKNNHIQQYSAQKFDHFQQQI